MPDSERFDVVFHTSPRRRAEEWRREHQIPRTRFVDRDGVDSLRGLTKVLVVGPRLIVPDKADQILGYIPRVETWDGRSNIHALLGLDRPTPEHPQQIFMNAAIEVCPDADGGWKVTEYTGQASNRVLYRSRTKRPAVLVGRGAALTWKCELRVKDRKGRYTRESTSYAGNGLPR